MLKLENCKKKNKQIKINEKSHDIWWLQFFQMSDQKTRVYQIRTITATSRNYEIFFNKDVYDMKERLWSLPCVKQYFKLKRWKIDVMKSSVRL